MTVSEIPPSPVPESPPRHSIAAGDPAKRRRRQWGAERSTEPLPVIHPRPSSRRVALSRLAIVITVVAWFSYVLTTVLREFINNGAQNFRFTMEAISYVLVVTMLTFSALMYLLARHGSLLRFREHRRAPRAELDAHFAESQPPMTVLVPSYAEEPGVVRQTLWSTALQEYPDLTVVLLIDDDPYPVDEAKLRRLEATRRLPAQVEETLEEPRTRLTDALVLFEMSLEEESDGERQNVVTESQALSLAQHYSWAAQWLQRMAAEETRADHVDEFFAEHVLTGLGHDLEMTAAALQLAVEEGELPSAERLLQLHRRLAWIFSARLSCFERKKFASLSHEANKAMNLNSYLELLGGSYCVETRPCGRVLVPVAEAEDADLVIPAADFVLTLDADSLLLPEYCLRLVHLLETPGNERVAVAQTPYSSYRGAGSRIERLAGATTDIQHLLHQGMTHAGATFWVGANAVIRTAALRDIAETTRERGFDVTRFVQDRTVIEDTESSIDLGTHGWTLTNYPERLSYSATPPDFGSLVVQRRRWANGGLLILPKFIRQIRDRRRRGEHVKFSEVLLRINYMASIAWASVGLIFLLAYPYDSRLLSPLILATALPYFITMGMDLRQCGYKFTDIFRIYGFNLILLPVNLAGVLKSLQQGLTGEKIPFVRTPKVKDRTAAPWLYVLVPVLIVVFSVFTFWRDFNQQNWGNAAFAAFNAFWASWAFLSYIGVRNAAVDVLLGWRSWFYVRGARRGKASQRRKKIQRGKKAQVRYQPALPQAEERLDWRLVLEEGTVQYRPAKLSLPKPPRSSGGQRPDSAAELPKEAHPARTATDVEVEA